MSHNVRSVGEFGELTVRACQQWARNPALGCRLSAVRYALRHGLTSELLLHVWSADMPAVLGELEWCVERQPFAIHQNYA